MTIELSYNRFIDSYQVFFYDVIWNLTRSKGVFFLTYIYVGMYRLLIRFANPLNTKVHIIFLSIICRFLHDHVIPIHGSECPDVTKNENNISVYKYKYNICPLHRIKYRNYFPWLIHYRVIPKFSSDYELLKPDNHWSQVNDRYITENTGKSSFFIASRYSAAGCAWT